MSSAAELAALRLDADNAEARLELLKEKLSADRQAGFVPQKSGEVNNHIHTFYSFSPYSPSEAAYGAWRAGLEAAGIIDHDSVAGCSEMLEAGRLIGMPVTSGCELRVSAAGTVLEDRRINNPDSTGILYMVIHGIPHNRRNEVDEFLKPVRESRNKRNRKETEKLNKLLASRSLPGIDFDKEVVPVSKTAEGGSITERHILFALAGKFEQHFGRGEKLLSVLNDKLGISVPSSAASRLSDDENPHFLYDLLGIFKGSLVPEFFIQPDSDECPPVKDATALAAKVGAIACYPYLGDVGESPTGDKKAEKFEDDWLDELFELLPDLGFRGVSYMPPRNTKEQLLRVKELCRSKSLMEISGVDINSSRQSFRCPEVTLPEFIHLNDRTWALIAHEHLSTIGGPGLFDPESPVAGTALENRLDIYAQLGRKMDPANPESVGSAAVSAGIWKG